MDEDGKSNDPQEQILLKDIDRKKVEKTKKAGTSKNGPDENMQNFLLESEAKKLEVSLYGQKQFLDLQKSWAGHIKWQIWVVLIFQFLFVIAIGFNVNGFTDNLGKLPYVYIGVIFETLANIIALGLVVSKFLFPQSPSSNPK